ncbi:hypothetical protein M2347_002399 [Chryseobacterium sp. H1D6B]|uniref:hypothetical protein n=1 Tax=Chryseobacterium sp. H1D6B TaxID=2940588 RepID=UPI0015C8D4A5|nr:hypothetical protein [Chryseobacterium sp. H1D6B]MDH6252672.1 hypothetical protein [Chryseobacterium sp. H1D6B]
MKNLFRITFLFALMLGTFSFANNKTSNGLIESLPSLNHLIKAPSTFKYGCKTFHVKVSIKLLEIETDVTICVGCTKFMAVTCGGSISKGQKDLSFGGMDLNTLMKDKKFADAKEITVLESSKETDEDITLFVKKGTYKINKDENGYGTIVNLEQVK